MKKNRPLQNIDVFFAVKNREGDAANKHAQRREKTFFAPKIKKGREESQTFIF